MVIRFLSRFGRTALERPTNDLLSPRLSCQESMAWCMAAGNWPVALPHWEWQMLGWNQWLGFDVGLISVSCFRSSMAPIHLIPAWFALIQGTWPFESTLGGENRSTRGYGTPYICRPRDSISMESNPAIKQLSVGNSIDEVSYLVVRMKEIRLKFDVSRERSYNRLCTPKRDDCITFNHLWLWRQTLICTEAGKATENKPEKSFVDIVCTYRGSTVTFSDCAVINSLLVVISRGESQY